MEIRFNTISQDVEAVLETIDKNNRKFFVETAILHYIKYLETEGAIDLFYNSRKLKDQEQPKAKKKEVKPNKTEKAKVDEKEEDKIDEKPKATDNASLAAFGW